ncbi:hypothetical protein JCM11491_002138 [Sporobolomyces phaffii]
MVVKQANRSLIIYGPHLFPPRLASLLQGLAPVSSSTVVVPSAFLSFDIKGVPFLEPCFANCIVQGYNDRIESNSSDDRSDAYKRWVWERCATGAEYEGNLPHALEGVVYEMTSSEFDVLLGRLLSASPATRHSLVSVEFTPFVNGDPDAAPRPDPSRGENRAELVVFDSVGFPSSGPLQPTQQYLALILRGAFFTGPLSRTYLAHLFLLRPYDPTRTFANRVLAVVARVVLVPEFVLVYLPARVFAAAASSWSRARRAGARRDSLSGARGGGGGWFASRRWSPAAGLLEGIERVVARVTGVSGYRNFTN